MKNSLPNIITLFIVITISASCNPKLSPPFDQQAKLRYSHTWKKLSNYPMQYGRNDDLHFFNPAEGFMINSEGRLFLTEDAGENWELKFSKEEKSFFRCLTFKDRQHGWLGTLGPGDNSLPSDDPVTLYETEDGGDNWSPVEFEGPYPTGLCGLQTVSESFIVGCGRVRGPSFFIKSTDGGGTWQSYDYNHLAGSLIAPYFYDEQHGILVGGTTTDKLECHSLVLETFDAGATWDTIFVSPQKGEYGWKVDFPSKDRGFISIQRNAKEGYTYYLETFDGGKTWLERKFDEGKYYVQGVGFINEKIGWLGGNPRGTKETRDGGQTWYDMIDAGRGYNNFQFFGDSVGYGVGFGVYKMEGAKPIAHRSVDAYFENGKMKSSISYKDGRRNGSAKYYHENGKLQGTGKMKNNIRVGSWQFYKSNGTPLQKLKFKNGFVQLAPDWLNQFVGTYQINESASREIFYNKGFLFSKHSDVYRSIKLLPISHTEFILESNSRNTLEFVLDAKGKVSHQLMHVNDRSREAKLVADQAIR